MVIKISPIGSHLHYTQDLNLLKGVADTLIIQNQFFLTSIIYCHSGSNWQLLCMHSITASITISLHCCLFQEGPAFSKKTGVIYIVYCSVGSTVVYFCCDPKYIVIIYHCPGNFQVCIHIVCLTCGDQIIKNNIGLSIFLNILLVRLTFDLFLCTYGCLVQFVCLGTLSIRGTISYGSYHFSDDRFEVILVHFSCCRFLLPLPHCFCFGEEILVYYTVMIIQELGPILSGHAFEMVHYCNAFLIQIYAPDLCRLVFLCL